MISIAPIYQVHTTVLLQVSLTSVDCGSPGAHYPQFFWLESLCSPILFPILLSLECLVSKEVCQRYSDTCITESVAETLSLLWFITRATGNKCVQEDSWKKKTCWQPHLTIISLCNTRMSALPSSDHGIWSHIYTKIYTLTLAKLLRSPDFSYVPPFQIFSPTPRGCLGLLMKSVLLVCCCCCWKSENSCC